MTSCDLYPSTDCFVSRQRLSHKHTNTVDQKQCLQTCGPPICCTCQTAAYAITNALLGEKVSQTPMLPSTTLCQSDYQICDGKLCMLDITEVCTLQPELWHKVAAFQGLCTHNARRQPCQMCTSETTNAGCKTGFAQLCAETACTCRWRLSSFWAFPKTSSTKRFCRASSISGPNAWMASFVFLSTCQALVSCACPAFQHVHIVLVP